MICGMRGKILEFGSDMAAIGGRGPFCHEGAKHTGVGVSSKLAFWAALGAPRTTGHLGGARHASAVPSAVPWGHGRLPWAPAVRRPAHRSAAAAPPPPPPRRRPWGPDQGGSPWFGLIQVSVRPKLLLRLLQYRGKPGPPTWSTSSVGHTGATVGLPARALTGSASLGP